MSQQHRDGDGLVVRLLDADPELGEQMRPDRRREARERLHVRMIELPRGEWSYARADVLGHLVMGGALAREVVLEDIVSSELLGGGDFLLPRPAGAEDGFPGEHVRWQVLASARVAVLDGAFTAAVSRFPEINAALMARLGVQAERLATLKAIAQLNSVERRVLALLRHLADRWGRMTPRGVVIPLTISHRLLGELIGARRPTVSVAVGGLGRKDAVHRLEDGTWLLTAQLATEVARAPRRAVPHRRRLVTEGG